MTGAQQGAATLPPQHGLRSELNDEVHARPPEALVPPVRISQLAMLQKESTPRDAAWEALCDLARRHGIPEPLREARHFSADFGAFRLKWERHTEFSRYTAIVPGAGADGFASPALAALPADWVASLPGEMIAATHAALLPMSAVDADPAEIAARLFDGNQLIGARLFAERGLALTDFRIHADGFGRTLILDRAMTPWQAGRIVQQLLEVDSYRILALLALPIARALVPVLAANERDLAEITAAMVQGDSADEPELLAKLTRLAAETENREARDRYRFDAAAAYHTLVRTRIEDLREDRIEGLQTFREFTERRLAPAMSTCRAVAIRQEQLAARIARATRLLSTQVDLTRQQQNQALLGSVDRSARMQLRLQQTVEGLSVAAITYYLVGMLAYVLRGVGVAGVPVPYEVMVAASVPIIALMVYLGTRRLRRAATHEAESGT
ncbi:DUF3422 domain-containing protein [Roseomonas sp. CAU 1739]|uniref:DUF3422 family protein n=1 Tax=Roseomonas sp. CAU 1739 TaxID=3140364 RepID=UPI00325A4B1E